MTIDEAVKSGMIVDGTEFSNAVWPEMRMYFSTELYRFLLLAGQYATVGQAISGLLEDIDYRIDIESLELGTDHLLEVMVGEIPEWIMVLRNIGVRQVLLANPHDDVTQMEIE